MPTNPELLKMPFAQDGDKNSIPETTSPTTGLFSQQYGFQSINSLPLTAGGKAISRLDYNGAMYMLSNLLYYAQRGYTFVYDDTMPYVTGCRVLDPNDGQVYNCVADVAAGVGAPSATPGNWELAPSADVLGFRKPNTEYTVGQIAPYATLPTGYYLICTTPGISGSGDLVINNPAIGDTVTDGTVTWTVSRDLPLIGGGALTGNNLTWNGNDLGGASIVAQSLGTNGYVKYSSGLIVQWGRVYIDGTGTVQFPVSFSNEYAYGMSILNWNNTVEPTQYAILSYTASGANVAANLTGGRALTFIAIGY